MQRDKKLPGAEQENQGSGLQREKSLPCADRSEHGPELPTGLSNEVTGDLGGFSGWHFSCPLELYFLCIQTVDSPILLENQLFVITYI